MLKQESTLIKTKMSGDMGVGVGDEISYKGSEANTLRPRKLLSKG